MNEEDLKATKIQIQVLEEILSYKDKEIEKLKRHIEAINEWIDSNIATGGIYCYDTTPFPKLEE